MSLLFSPYQVKNLSLKNRIVMSPMCMYSATDTGEAADWHLAHYGARAAGGVGLIILEATAVESRGRISGNDLGLWDDRQMAGLQQIVNFAHAQGCKIGIQLAHAGRKAGVKEDVVAPSPIPYQDGEPLPRELSVEELSGIVESFAKAARRARAIGFDVVEVHAAHGYLLHEFLSPVSNKREDQYGGSLSNRFRLLKETVQAVREEWPAAYPLFVRISAEDYVTGGLQIGDSVDIARLLKEIDVDLIDVSSGAILPVRPPSMFPGYQVQYADAIKRETGIATGTVGLITLPQQAEEILGNGRADLVFLGRELLRNPNWALLAARDYGQPYEGPEQYRRAF